jgi:hypothetical protein
MAMDVADLHCRILDPARPRRKPGPTTGSGP